MCQYDSRKYKKFYCIAKYLMYLYSVRITAVEFDTFSMAEVQECCFFSAF